MAFVSGLRNRRFRFALLLGAVRRFLFSLFLFYRKQRLKVYRCFQKSAPQVSTAPKLALAHNGIGFATGCLLRTVPLGVALSILTALV
jgi:hypothetical protein